MKEPTKTEYILSDVKRLENRLRCYHEGSHGRSVVRMHVELKMIDNIKKQLEKLYAD